MSATPTDRDQHCRTHYPNRAQCHADIDGRGRIDKRSRSVENAENDFCVMINIPKFYVLGTARIPKLHKHPRPSHKRSRRSIKFHRNNVAQNLVFSIQLPLLLPQVLTAAELPFVVPWAIVDGSCFSPRQNIFGRSKRASRNSSRICRCVSMACKEFTVVWTCWLVAASLQRISLKKKMKKGGFSVLMNIVRFCTNRSTSHFTVEHTSCQCIGGGTLKSTPYRTRTCRNIFLALWRKNSF